MVGRSCNDRALGTRGGCMWWKGLLAYLMALGGLLWFVYRFGNSVGRSNAPTPGSSSS